MLRFLLLIFEMEWGGRPGMRAKREGMHFISLFSMALGA